MPRLSHTRLRTEENGAVDWAETGVNRGSQRDGVLNAVPPRVCSNASLYVPCSVPKHAHLRTAP
jgi:hypothetical protein